LNGRYRGAVTCNVLRDANSADWQDCEFYHSEFRGNAMFTFTLTDDGSTWGINIHDAGNEGPVPLPEDPCPGSWDLTAQSSDQELSDWLTQATVGADSDEPAESVPSGAGVDIADRFSASLPASLPNGFNRTHLQASNDPGVRVEALYRLGERDLWIVVASKAAAERLAARSPSMPFARTERESLERGAIAAFYQAMEQPLGSHYFEDGGHVNTEIDGRVHSHGLDYSSGQTNYAIIGQGVAVVAVFDRGGTEEEARTIATSLGIERLEQVVRDVEAGERSASRR